MTTPPGPGGTAMPSRWQIDVLVYEETSSYPVLLLQPGHPGDHGRLHGILRRAGLAAPTAWEWERGLWPLAAGCRVELSDGPAAVTVHAGGYRLTVGFELVEAPLPWLTAARRQQQVLFVLLPPGPPADALIADDASLMHTAAERAACLAGTIPLDPGFRRSPDRGRSG
ncbi:hypothetical protein [Amycolatopsis australiensis]|uniref:Uncharacterized protein n=1 Tax=Amycolatopsis australiensis TaxID=546364 RepID=A0A1K1SMH6_9PSEU|nr:hypothetical protein [Amycolatopsis australiensis]SFW85498.1 hypothetical protein SAMN04489730_6153 [Amycolatopsis australiensis]